MTPWIVLGTLLEPLLGMLYPPRCIECRRLGHGWVCSACVDALAPPSGPRCPRCDLPLGSPATAAAPADAAGPSADRPATAVAPPDCPDCRAARPRFECLRAVGSYSGLLKTALTALKFEGCWPLADPLARLLASTARGALPVAAMDAVASIPTDPARAALRGYDQAHLLAWRVAVRLGLPLARGLLVRVEAAARPQSHSGQGQRRANVEHAFAVPRPAAVRGKRILLVDDVCTTGATLNAAAGALSDSGARAWGLVVARGALRRWRGRTAA